MIQYFLEVSIAWIIFYSIYFFFLKRETFFASNRWYLINTLWIGAIIPFLRKIPWTIETTQAIIIEPVTIINHTTHSFSNYISQPTQTNAFNWEWILLLVYVTGVVLTSIKMFVGLNKIRQIFVNGKKEKFSNYTLVLSEKFHLPFSFLKYIFLSESFLKHPSIKEILDHETIHVESRHTLDVLFMEIMSIVFWWNPMIYLYKKSIKETHEYVADAYASQHTHKKNYGRILLGQSSSGIELALTNQFFNSHLKKRMTMLYQKKSARYKLSKYLLVIPFFVFLTFLFSSNTIAGDNEIISEPLPSFIEASTSPDDDLRLMTTAVDGKMKLGRSYAFKIIKDPTLKENVEFAVTPSIAHLKIVDDKIDFEKEGIFKFDVTIESMPKNDEKVKVKVWTISKSVELEFDVEFDNAYQKETLAVANSEDVQDAEYKIKYYHNGEPFEIEGKETFELDGYMLYTTDSVDLKKNYNVTGKVRVVDLIGTLSTDPIRLITKWDQSQDLEVGKSYLFTLKYMGENPEDWRPKVYLKETHAKIEFVEDRVGEVDFMVTPKVEIKGGLDLTLICEDQENRIEKSYRIAGMRTFTTEGKEDVHVSERSFYQEGMTDPLVVINGKISESELEHYFTESKVHTVNVLSGKAALAKYGKRAIDGAIEVNGDFQANTEEPKADYPVPSQYEEVFKVVEEMPRFPGCEHLNENEKSDCSTEMLLAFVQSNINYPEAAKNNKVEGRVYVQFIVRKDGSVTDGKVVRDIGSGCGDEALRMINKMPKWIPGKQRGQLVDVLFTLPVKYRLPSGEAVNIELSQNYPNPWREQTTVNFNLEKAEAVKFMIYNVQGNVIDQYEIDGKAGKNEIVIDKDKFGNKFGVYYYSIRSTNDLTVEPTRKMVFMEPNGSSDKMQSPSNSGPSLPPPPPPPPSPEEMLTSLFDRCANPVILMNGTQITREAFEGSYRHAWKSLRVSQNKEDLNEYYISPKDCGVILLEVDKKEVERINAEKKQQSVKFKNNNGSECEPLFFINGQQIVAPVLEEIDPSDIKKIEVVKNKVQLRSMGIDDSSCGAVFVTLKNKQKTRKYLKDKRGSKIKIGKESIGEVVDGELQESAFESGLIRNDVVSTYGLQKQDLKTKIKGAEKYDYLSFRFTEEGTKLEDQMPFQLKIFGNPVTDQQLKFQFNSEFDGPCTVHITDMNGRPVAQEKYNTSGAVLESQISLTNLTPGVYSMTVFQGTGSVSKKFIIQ